MDSTSLAPVVGVDGDVAVGQVAGPHRGLAAADADVDIDIDLAALDMRLHRRLVIAGDDTAILISNFKITAILNAMTARISIKLRRDI